MPKKEQKFIEAPQWIGHGTGRLLNRDGLQPSHPESWASLWLKKYGSLDGFPVEKHSFQGACHNGDIYFTCNHCDVINVVGNAEVGIF